MLNGKEQKTGENNNSKPMGKGFFVVGCVIIYFLIVGIVSAAIHLPVAITKISDNSERLYCMMDLNHLKMLQMLIWKKHQKKKEIFH